MRLAFFLSPSFNAQLIGDLTEHVTAHEAAWLFSFFGAVSGQIFGLHSPLLPRSRGMFVTQCIGASLLALGFVATIIFAVLYQRIGRLILSQVILYYPISLALARFIVWRQFGHKKQRVLLLGAGSVGRSVLCLLRQSNQPFEVVAFVDHSRALESCEVEDLPVLPGRSSLVCHCANLRIDEVVSCVGGNLTDEALGQVMECLSLGVQVRDFTRFVETNFLQVPVEHIRGEWFLHADLELGHPIYQAMKRGTDIFASLIGLICMSPLIVLAAVAIKLENPGPAFYSQIRTGRLNQPFRIWKLRTMRVDAESSGPQWARKSDGRVLRIGRILRKTRIDEVPQFWNILSGEMSLVGPRPERPEFVEPLGREIPFYQQRHLVKPGLTGWAQINYPYGASVHDALMKLKYDLYYIKHASLGLDFQIILRTIGAVMKGAQ